MSTASAINSTFISRHEEGAVYQHPLTQHHSFIAVNNYTPGNLICHFSAGEHVKEPSRYTVQTGELNHILLVPEHLQYINHSCDPSAFFDTDNYQLIALKQINEGDEITFFYPSTEWEMAESFTCLCGSEQCLGIIKGASQLPEATIRTYRLTRYIQSKLDNR